MSPAVVKPPRRWRSLEVRVGVLAYRSNAAESRVLLIRRKGRSEWSVPKGKLMPGRAPHEAAQIEAFEEAGLSGSIDGTPIGSVIHVRSASDNFLFGDPVELVLYRLSVQAMFESWPEKPFRERLWVPIRELDLFTPNRSLREIIREHAPVDPVVATEALAAPVVSQE